MNILAKNLSQYALKSSHSRSFETHSLSLDQANKLDADIAALHDRWVSRDNLPGFDESPNLGSVSRTLYKGKVTESFDYSLYGNGTVHTAEYQRAEHNTKGELVKLESWETSYQSPMTHTLWQDGQRTTTKYARDARLVGVLTESAPQPNSPSQGGGWATSSATFTVSSPAPRAVAPFEVAYVDSSGIGYDRHGFDRNGLNCYGNDRYGN